MYIYCTYFNYTPSLPPGANCFSFFSLSTPHHPPPQVPVFTLGIYIYTYIYFGLFFSFLFLVPGFPKASDLMPPSPPPPPLSHWDFSFLFFCFRGFPKANDLMPPSSLTSGFLFFRWFFFFFSFFFFSLSGFSQLMQRQHIHFILIGGKNK